MGKTLQAVLACLVIFVSSVPGAEVAANEGVQKTLDSWVRMWNTYDVRQVEDLFCNCDELSYFSSEKEGLIRGFDAVAEHHYGFGFEPRESDRGTKLWLEDLVLADFGAVYLATATWYFERPERIQKGPVTILLQQRKSGDYEIVHMNFSNY